MRSIKSVLVALVAVVALSAVAASGASASSLHYYVNGTKLAEGVQENVVSKGTESFILKWKYPNTQSSIKIECTTEEGKGWVENPAGGGEGQGEEEMTFRGCTMTEPAEGCTVAPITWSTITRLIDFETKAAEQFKAKGASFREVDVSGCLLAGGYSLTGYFDGLVNNAGSSLEFTPRAGSLKFAAEPATLKGKLTRKTESGVSVTVE